ncbi:MAG TPA: serine/threonine protein kinase [Methylophilaceae bacterium]|nr:serine/threonine protein kinase [Methylophilaceae bacterium]HAJ71983.1 serine/threonine protein kinase [Methylophilaceae bacterium]
MAVTNKNQALPIGFKLQDYTITKVLSSGGFSFVYLAHDPNKKIVAIKEYMPTGLALRDQGTTVQLDKHGDSSAFKHGLKSFFEEGLALARIDHKNIVRVLNFFRANNTVYMVMKYERGKSLQEYILAHETPISENFVRRVFAELLTGLREVHTHKLLHLDIKPANIYIRLDGSPVLLDFGSARQTLSSNQSNMPLSYTPGFAPPEQYFDRKNLGPWSDIYSVGASMYSCLYRATPQAANLRTTKDNLEPAVSLGSSIYSKELLELIDECLKLDFLSRPQSVFSLQKSIVALNPLSEPNKNNLINKIKNVLNKNII